jgi:hypothetical protein
MYSVTRQRPGVTSCFVVLCAQLPRAAPLPRASPRAAIARRYRAPLPRAAAALCRCRHAPLRSAARHAQPAMADARRRAGAPVNAAAAAAAARQRRSDQRSHGQTAAERRVPRRGARTTQTRTMPTQQRQPRRRASAASRRRSTSAPEARPRGVDDADFQRSHLCATLEPTSALAPPSLDASAPPSLPHWPRAAPRLSRAAFKGPGGMVCSCPFHHSPRVSSRPCRWRAWAATFVGVYTRRRRAGAVERAGVRTPSGTQTRAARGRLRRLARRLMRRAATGGAPAPRASAPRDAFLGVYTRRRRAGAVGRGRGRAWHGNARRARAPALMGVAIDAGMAAGGAPAPRASAPRGAFLDVYTRRRRAGRAGAGGRACAGVARKRAPRAGARADGRGD